MASTTREYPPALMSASISPLSIRPTWASAPAGRRVSPYSVATQTVWGMSRATIHSASARPSPVPPKSKYLLNAPFLPL